MGIRKIPPEKGMATHSSVLAWRIPWTEEPGGLRSMGLQRVRHDLVTEHTNQVWERGSLGGCQSRKWFSWEQTRGVGSGDQ